MKSLVKNFSILIFIISCASPKPNSLESIEDEYWSKDAEYIKSNEAVLEGKILDLRQEAVSNQDTMTVLSLDSILLDGTEAPQYQEIGDNYDSLNQALPNIRKCRTLDQAPQGVARVKSNRLRLPSTPVQISVFFHVIQDSLGVGYLNNQTLQDQLDVLNRNFASTLFSFQLAGVDSIRNDAWYYDIDMGTQEEVDMHRTLAVNPDQHLNVYFAGNSSYLGYAQFPWDDRSEFDGVVILNSTLPGGSEVEFNQGKTLTHEVGHYLGLWHTFHKGCSVGDDVYDTPEEAIPTDGCPTGKDTCPTAGNDPITNYMDYSYDDCMKEFTKGQNNRMNWAVRKYRKGLTSLFM